MGKSVDSIECRDRLRDRGLRRFRARDIARDQFQRSVFGAQFRFERSAIEIDRGDPVAFGKQALRAGAANAARGSGHDDALARVGHDGFSFDRVTAAIPPTIRQIPAVSE